MTGEIEPITPEEREYMKSGIVPDRFYPIAENHNYVWLAAAYESALSSALAQVETLKSALEPFATAWDVATHHKNVVAHLTLAQLGELAAHEVSGVHFQRARAAWEGK